MTYSAKLQPDGPTVWLYDVRTVTAPSTEWEWQARVIITSDGCLFVRSWWGAFAYFWNGPGMPMREFIVSTDAGYLAGKLANPNEKNPGRGRKTGAEEFCARALPRLKEILRTELELEAYEAAEAAPK